MSDSEHSSVTYTSVPSPVKDYSDIGLSEVDGPPSSDYVPGLEEPEQASLSPNYVPGPEEPEQAPLSPNYVPGPEEPKQAPPLPVYLPYPLPIAATPTAGSPGYIPESDLKGDLEEDDEEDLEEDPADYPADSTVVGLPAVDHVPSEERLRFASPTPSREVRESSAAGAARQDEPVVAMDDPYSLVREELYGFVDRVDVAPRRPMSKELDYGITDTWDELVGANKEITPTTLQGVNQRVTDLSTIIEKETTIMYGMMEDAQDDWSQLRGRVNLLYRDRPVHHRLATQMIEFQKHHGPVKGPAQPDAPGEADYIDLLFCLATQYRSFVQCWGNMAFDHAHSGSVGNSGVILCIWDTYSFIKQNVTVSDYFVIIGGTWRATSIRCLMIAVYAPQDSRDKIILWDYLQHVIGLVEVNLGGCRYTWCHKSAKKMSKLDRFLVSENLLTSCPNINAITLEKYLSDHRPILLRENAYDYGPTPFRYFHRWIEVDGFRKLVEESWRNSPSEGPNAMKILMVDLIIDSGQGNDDDLRSRMDIMLKLQHYEDLESIEVAQKAKIRWAVEGDKNSKFFHGTLNKKRNILGIRGVLVDGVWVDDPKGVKREFYDHFSKRFSKPVDGHATISMEFPNRLQSDQCRELETEDLVEQDVLEAVIYFISHDVFPKGCNSSFIALIPKIPDANLVKDFRPISLIGCIYKIIAKILSNRLVKVLSYIVNEVQSAFVANRQILYGPFIVNEMLSWCKAKKKQALVFKVNIEKALHISFQRVVDEGLFHGIKLHDTVNISHLFYADDAVFVGNWSERNIATLTHVLKCFHMASRLKINMSKSKIMGVHVNKDVVAQAAVKLGLIIAIHGVDGKIGMASKCGTNSCWSNIVKEVELMSKKDISLMKFMQIKVGNGDNTRLWEDLWHSGGTLKDRFPRVYALESYKAICADKVNIHAWKIMSNALATKFNISSRGIEIESLICVNCDVGVETTSHLFFTCITAQQVSRLINRWWNISDVSVVEVVSFDSWKTWMGSIRLNSKSKMLFEGV
nr:RNA-directed DNA polymerase, eukaryota [Tanacetum cinerariifolium]